MCKFGSSSRSVISLLISGFLSITTISLAAGQSVTTNQDRNLKNPAWTVPLSFWPDHLPPPGSGLSTDTPVWNFGRNPAGDGFDCPPITIKVPRSHIGLHNSSGYRIGIVLDIQVTGQTNVTKIVVLEAREFVTVECDGCQIKATVPKGEQPITGDFKLNLTGGNVYTPSYVVDKQRWELSLQPKPA
jgi:hypothetical protein